MLIRLIALIAFVVSTAVSAHAESTWDAYVVSVEDGNTVTVSTKYGSKEPEFVLIFYGIEAPTQSQPFGREAIAYLQRIMPVGTKVGVESV